MNIHRFDSLWKGEFGRLVLASVAFGLVIGGVVYWKHLHPATPAKPAHVAITDAQASRSTVTTFDNNIPIFHVPPPPPPSPAAPSAPTKPAPKFAMSPMAFAFSDTPVLGDHYAAYGRLLRCKLLITVDSNHIQTPIVGTLLEDVCSPRRELLIPAGAELHGMARNDSAEDRIASQNQWVVVWRTNDSREVELPLTGPSRFPVGRNQKRNPTADRRFQDMVQFRRRTLDALRKALDPESHPIMAGDEDAVARLKAKLAEAEQRQVLMREVNAAIRRHAQEGEAAQARALIALNPKLDESDARELLFPDACGRVGFTAYQLANNNANIRRIKGRIALLSRDQATAPTTQRGDNGVLYEDCPADHRVRLFFPIIPPAEVRARLKNRTGSAGVRGCAAGRPAALPRPWSALSDSSLPPSNPSMPTAMKTPNPSAGRFGITSGALFGDRRTKSARGGIDHDVDSFSGQYLWTSLHRGGV